MASIPGRSGRRRRVLNEEVLSASASHLALRAAPEGPALAARRYSDPAAVENHPQVSDFIPRRHRTIAMLLVIGLAATGAVAACHQLSAKLVSATGTVNQQPLEISAGNSLAAWLGSMVLFVACLSCALVYSIRRHRIDDFRGRYRIWRWAAVACLIASANNVAPVHALLADLLTHYSGWGALRGGAVWWLALAGIPLMWIALRAVLESRESVSAVLLMASSFCAYMAAITSFLGWLPGVEPMWEPLVTGGIALLGHWLVLTAVVSYARHVVLDAQGLIPTKQAAPQRRKDRSSSSVADVLSPPGQEKDLVRQPPTNLRVHNPPVSTARPTLPITPAKSQAKPSEWVDGSRRERDRFDEDDNSEDENNYGGDHKLSKAERKQLRKLKARNRAA
jgi:hypothetical protein